MRKWLAEERKKAGLTQLEVAEKIGISESYYNFIEAGQRQKKMDIVLILKLSDIFGIPVERIVKLETE